jgi:hypothetical protein
MYFLPLQLRRFIYSFTNLAFMKSRCHGIFHLFAGNTPWLLQEILPGFCRKYSLPFAGDTPWRSSSQYLFLLHHVPNPLYPDGVLGSELFNHLPSDELGVSLQYLAGALRLLTTAKQRYLATYCTEATPKLRQRINPRQEALC